MTNPCLKDLDRFRHRSATGCRWRKLTPDRQALLVLVHLRCGDSFVQLGFSFDVSAVTAYRYVGEAVELLAEQAPGLDNTISGRVGRDQVTILDGTIIPTLRVRWTSEYNAWYVHRKKTYGVNAWGTSCGGYCATDRSGRTDESALWLAQGSSYGAAYMAADKRLCGMSVKVPTWTISARNSGRSGWSVGTMSDTDLGETVVQSIDWSRYRISTGNARKFGDALLQLLQSRSPDESGQAWNGIENFVFAQDTIFSAAEPTIDVILAALVADRQRHVKITLIDLLFLVLNGSSTEDPGLSERCHGRAMRGIWLLASQAAGAEEPIREAILEAMDLIDPVQTQTLRAWLAS